MTPRARLGLLAAVVVSVPLVLALTDVVSADELRDVVRATGPLAPVAYVAVSGLLGVLLVPGPVLAATSGLLFGPVLGTVVTLASALVSALVSLQLGRRGGRAGTVDLLGERAEPVARLVQRRGTIGVAVQRLVPGVPDGPLNYAYGALGLRARQVVLGTLIGSLPRAFSYTALGASADDPTSGLAVAGLVGLVVTGVVGALLGAGVWRRVRASRRPADPEA